MGWFDSQIQERQRAEAERMADAVSGLAEALTGAGGSAAAGRASVDAVADILAYLGARPATLPGGVTELAEVIEMQVRPRGIMFREVALAPGWSREATGPILATREDGSPVALLPAVTGGYAYRDHAQGRTVRVGGNDMVGLAPRALLFYRPLPSRSLTRRDIYAYLVRAVGRRDWAMVALAAACVSVLGLVVPAVNEYVFGPLLAAGDEAAALLAPVLALLLSIIIAQVIISSVRTMLIGRMGTAASTSFTAALMMRVLQLPTWFFKRNAAGDLASRVLSMPNMVKVLQQAVLSVGLTVVFSLVYLVQVLAMTPALALPAAMAAAASLGVCALVALRQARRTAEQLTWRAKRSGWEFSLIAGMQKIRLAGAEARAFSTWADIYKNEVRITYGEYLNPVLVCAASLAGTLAVYASAAGAGVSAAEFMAFASAYGMVSIAIATLSDAAVAGMAASPYLDLIDPILQAVPDRKSVV